MQSRFRKSILTAFRKVAAIACLGAVSVQLALPVAHVAHESAHAITNSASIDALPALRANVPAGEIPQRHHAAACPICRSASELRTLVATGAFHLEAQQSTATAIPPAPRMLLACNDDGVVAARAPPFLA